MQQLRRYLKIVTFGSGSVNDIIQYLKGWKIRSLMALTRGYKQWNLDKTFCESRDLQWVPGELPSIQTNLVSPKIAFKFYIWTTTVWQKLEKNFRRKSVSASFPLQLFLEFIPTKLYEAPLIAFQERNVDHFTSRQHCHFPLPHRYCNFRP